MSLEPKILVIDFCNYEDYPVGGYLSFAKNLVESFSGELALVGITTNLTDPVGTWFKKDLDGVIFDYFAVARYTKNRTKHFIPDRLVIYFLLKYYKRAILQINIANVFVQRQEILQAVTNFRFKNICYCFAGLENPLAISKYRYAGFLAGKFEKFFFKSLKQAKIILASGDEDSIQAMVDRSEGRVKRSSVIKFPTRINTDIFYPAEKIQARKILGLPPNATIIITTGRLAWFKGWKFMIDAFEVFNQKSSDSIFYMIGDGEDQQKIRDYIESKRMQNKVVLTGMKQTIEVALFLNASDLFIMGSQKEGWSTSLSEAIACGIPACVTDFSSAKEIIQEGSNGYVISGYNLELFVHGMTEALKITKPVYNENVKCFASNKLKQDMLEVWQLV
jgi:glycosyltransferase involved in cell wall biosynthesis